MYPVVHNTGLFLGLGLLCQITHQRVSAKGVSAVALACARNNLVLNCPAGNVIRIKEIVLADSKCTAGARCCPKSNDCTDAASEGHKNQINRACNGRMNCTVTVETRNITCGSSNFRFRIVNDYERIAYECIVQQHVTTTMTAKSSTRPATRKGTATVPLDSDADKTTSSTSSAAAATLSRTQLLVICITVPLIFLALILFNIFLWWRLRRRPGHCCCPLIVPWGANNNSATAAARTADDYEKIDRTQKPSQAVYCALLHPSAGTTLGGTSIDKNSQGIRRSNANVQTEYEDIDRYQPQSFV